MKDGTTVTNPGVHNPDILSPLGEPNNTVKLLKVIREGGYEVASTSIGPGSDDVIVNTVYSALKELKN